MNLQTFIPENASFLDPEVRAAKEKELTEFASNGIMATARNPERKLQHEFTGTHQLTEQELSDREIIWAAREQRSKIIDGIRRLEQNAMSDVNKYHQFIVDAAKAIEEL